MSFLERTFLPCPCRTRRCRLHYAARVLAAAAGIATVLAVYLTTGIVI